MSFLDWSRSQRRRVTTRFVDPEGHVRPTRLGELFAYGPLDPHRARLTRAVLHGAFVSYGFCVGQVVGNSLSESLLCGVVGAVLSIPLTAWVLGLTDWYRKRRHPRGAELARTKEGLNLLMRGEDLYRMRELLLLQDGPDERLEERWQQQLDRERELRERQNRLLADDARGA